MVPAKSIRQPRSARKGGRAYMHTDRSVLNANKVLKSKATLSDLIKKVENTNIVSS